ncbi:STAS domain-containing protein [Candidatus Magnetomonas plexicatena]|uniref:STAS domain-containing protein n=1 Tax=Candidatus Magnetomonas plexicatena TaxID=2552947 RepID=UPI001C774084|nr:STAS domain-containing protein [Nitrospirales bacterium LBB_01]
MFSHKLSKAGELALEGDLTLQNIKEVKDALLKAINKANAITLNLEGATDVDFSFLQLVRAAQKSCEIREKTLTLENVPSRYQDLSEQSGFVQGHR